MDEPKCSRTSQEKGHRDCGPRDRGRQHRRHRGARQRRRTATATAVAPLPPGAFHDGEVTDPGSLTEALRGPFRRDTGSPAACGSASPTSVSWCGPCGCRRSRTPRSWRPPCASEAQEQIPMPIEQAVLDHRVIGGVRAAEGGAAANRRDRRRRPPRHDRRHAEAPARRRPGAVRSRPLGFWPDPRSCRPSHSRTRSSRRRRQRPERRPICRPLLQRRRRRPTWRSPRDARACSPASRQLASRASPTSSPVRAG